jgi:hypothetical protein
MDGGTRSLLPLSGNYTMRPPRPFSWRTIKPRRPRPSARQQQHRALIFWRLRCTRHCFSRVTYCIAAAYQICKRLCMAYKSWIVLR